jgi:hypothetical protein
MYAPAIQSARPIKHYKIGAHEAVFLSKIVSDGFIGYNFIIVVFENNTTDPFLFVTSERDNCAWSSGLFKDRGLEANGAPIVKEESHFLCLFDKKGHSILDHSDDWGDPQKFETAALKILKERFGETPIIVDPIGGG